MKKWIKHWLGIFDIEYHQVTHAGLIAECLVDKRDLRDTVDKLSEIVVTYYNTSINPKPPKAGKKKDEKNGK
jgi:hypothetical protein